MNSVAFYLYILWNYDGLRESTFGYFLDFIFSFLAQGGFWSTVWLWCSFSFFTNHRRRSQSRNCSRRVQRDVSWSEPFSNHSVEHAIHIGTKLQLLQPGLNIFRILNFYNPLILSYFPNNCKNMVFCYWCNIFVFLIWKGLYKQAFIFCLFGVT